MPDNSQAKLGEFCSSEFGSEDTSKIICPTCGKDDFNSEHGLKIHHTTVHNDQSLTLDERVEFECEWCGSTKQLTPDEAERRTYCSQECKNEQQSEAYSGEGGPGWEGGKVSVACSHCGVVEERFPSHVNDVNYCSDRCESEWKSEHVTGEDHPNYNRESVECAWCETELSRPEWRINKFQHQFCGMECRGEYYTANPSELHEKERVTVSCAWCGDTKEIISAQATRSENHFCNRTCKGNWWSENYTGESHPNWKGGYEPYYGSNWKQKRQETRERDGYECAICGVSDEASELIHDRELSVHHVTRINDFENPDDANKLENLLTICLFCHQRIFD